MQSFLHNIYSILVTIDLCLEKGRDLPALILIYSCIDILGSLEQTKGEGTQRSFIRWVERYLLKAKSLDCTAIDLYAARCAILHTLTSDSDLSRQGKARKAIYSWGTASVADLQEAAKRLNRDRVSIHINDLNEALVLGIDLYLDELGKDEARKNIVVTNAGKTYNNLPQSAMDDFLSNDE